MDMPPPIHVEQPLGVQVIARELKKREQTPNLAKRAARVLPFLSEQVQLQFDTLDRQKRGQLGGRRGVKNRRIIFDDGKGRQLHATKGWRTYRA